MAEGNRYPGHGLEVVFIGQPVTERPKSRLNCSCSSALRNTASPLGQAAAKSLYQQLKVRKVHKSAGVQFGQNLERPSSLMVDLIGAAIACRIFERQLHIRSRSLFQVVHRQKSAYLKPGSEDFTQGLPV